MFFSVHVIDELLKTLDTKTQQLQEEKIAKEIVLASKQIQLNDLVKQKTQFEENLSNAKENFASMAAQYSSELTPLSEKLEALQKKNKKDQEEINTIKAVSNFCISLSCFNCKSGTCHLTLSAVTKPIGSTILQLFYFDCSAVNVWFFE